jgi:hypothetical protein
MGLSASLRQVQTLGRTKANCGAEVPPVCGGHRVPVEPVLPNIHEHGKDVT